MMQMHMDQDYLLAQGSPGVSGMAVEWKGV
jgi:hypothetical protein